jgi:endoglucanase
MFIKTHDIILLKYAKRKANLVAAVVRLKALVRVLVVATLTVVVLSFALGGVVAGLTTKRVTLPSAGTVNYPHISYLHTEGKLIKNEFGETVYLRGCAKMCMEFETYYDVGAYNIRESDFDNIKRLLGVNIIRIDLALSLLFPTFDVGAPNPDYLATMDNIVMWCGDRDMYVLFDCHGYYPQMGAPSDFWDTLYNGIRQPYRNMISDFWVFIANRYNGNPTVFGFDLYNEPWNAVPAEDRPYPSEWKTVIEEWIDAITAVNPKLLFIVETAGHQMWGSDDWRWIATSPIERANVVYSPHFYPQRDDGSWKNYTWISLPGNTFASEYASGDYATAKEKMETFLINLFQDDLGYPILIGEFGFVANENGLQCLRDFLDISNKHGWSWTYWGWCGRPDWFWLVEEDWVTLTPQGQIVKEYTLP